MMYYRTTLVDPALLPPLKATGPEKRHGSWPARFWAKVEKTEGCWYWRGPMGGGGYGACQGQHPLIRAYAHRIAYELAFGVIPDGHQIDHLCGNKLCVNPSHLEAVTQSENIRRSASPSAENQRKTHCPAGHPYDATSTYISPRGGRQCRACNRLRWHAGNR